MAKKKKITAQKSQKVSNAQSTSTDLGTNVFATLSLIFGIVFFVPFAPILAIIFGFIGLHKIKETGERGKGMAIAGIILGFFWIIMFIILLIFLMIAFIALLGTTVTG